MVGGSGNGVDEKGKGILGQRKQECGQEKEGCLEEVGIRQRSKGRGGKERVRVK